MSEPTNADLLEQIGDIEAMLRQLLAEDEGGEAS